MGVSENLLNECYWLVFQIIKNRNVRKSFWKYVRETFTFKLNSTKKSNWIKISTENNF